MSQTTTLMRLANTLQTMSRDYNDNLLPVRAIHFNNLESIQADGEELEMSRLAQQAISRRLRIPYTYLARCPQSMQAEQLNHWLKHESNERLLLRMNGSKVRAIFTPRYKALDNTEVVGQLLQSGFSKDTKVSVDLNHEFMSLSILDQSTTKILGDELSPGINIANSEVGLTSLRIESFCLRLVCTNGMITKTTRRSSYRHISESLKGDFAELVQAAMSRNVIPAASIQQAMQTKVDDPTKIFQSVSSRFLLNDAEIQAVEWGWNHEQGDSLWHVANAYTKGAQHQELEPPSSYKLQAIGGDVITIN